MTTHSLSQETAALLADVIERTVMTRTSGRVWNLQVEIAQGRIILSGRARSHYTKQLAQHAAMDAVEPKNVPAEMCNRIVVAGSW